MPFDEMEFKSVDVRRVACRTCAKTGAEHYYSIRCEEYDAKPKEIYADNRMCPVYKRGRDKFPDLPDFLKYPVEYDEK